MLSSAQPTVTITIPVAGYPSTPSTDTGMLTGTFHSVVASLTFTVEFTLFTVKVVLAVFVSGLNFSSPEYETVIVYSSALNPEIGMLPFNSFSVMVISCFLLFSVMLTVPVAL